MPRDPKYDILFEPIQLGPKTLKNRFYQVPHCTGFGTDKPLSQARHRAVKAEGGWAAVCTEAALVSPDSDESPLTYVRLWDDEDTRLLALMTSEVHRFGALVGIELTHVGAHSHRRDSRWPALAPSQIASDALSPYLTPEAPKAMELDDIRRVTQAWVDGARRAREAGFDIVYVHGAQSTLLAQFLSPYYNKRRDRYGGSVENRARFWIEVLEAVKTEVGDDCAVAVRIAADALGPAGVPVSETIDFMRMADDYVDLWDLNVGSLIQSQKDSGPSRFYREGYQLEWTSKLREATKKPIVGVGRLTNADQMVEIIRSGAWDLIGAARPSIADPYLPRKIEEGRLDEIRECMGINSCVGRMAEGGHLGCTQNATAGEEHRRGWHPEVFTRARNSENDVLVLGAGPAGMECAIVLGRRGMRRVHLVDAAPEVGGAMNWITRLPGLGEWARLVNYRRIQLDKLKNVEVICGAHLDAKMVRDYGAEIAVFATGSHWATDGLSGVTHDALPGADASLAHVFTPEQIMVHGQRPAGCRVVVYDCEGYFVAAGLAEMLRLEGFEVQLLSPLSEIAPFCDETLEGPLLRRRLRDIGVTMRPRTGILRIDEDHVQVRDHTASKIELPADGVVLVTQRLSNEGLYLEVKGDRDALAQAGITAVYRVGDCVAPRLLADAVFDGHRLAREIDEADPSVPLPARREIGRPVHMTTTS